MGSEAVIYMDKDFEDEFNSTTNGDDVDVDWEALNRLKSDSAMERAVHGEKSSEELAEYILQEAAPQAAMAVVKIATADPSSSVRLRASQYILDRAIGRVGDGPTKNAPWEDVYAKTAVEETEDATTEG